MADFFCDHQNTTLYPTAYMSSPGTSAGLPQDGDGTVDGQGAAPAVSSASWDCTSASASSGTMTIMGATVTGITGAAGSAVATAAATAINASTATTTAPNGNISGVYLKALVWAVASGATLTVYSRIASVALNYANNTACAMAAGTGWTSAPATAQFSGGVSGPFAYLFNTAALGAAVSAGVGTTVGGYGAMPATVMGAVAAGDKVHIRSRRSGTDVLITLPSSAITVTTRNVGTGALPLWFIADYGNKWSSDAGQLTIEMNSALGYMRMFCMPTTTGLKQVWMGTKINDLSCSWKWNITGSMNYSGSLVLGDSGSAADNSIDIIGMEFGGATQAYTGGPSNSVNNVNGTLQFVRLGAPRNTTNFRDAPCLLLRDILFRTQALVSPISGVSTSGVQIRVENSIFDHRGVTSVSSAAIVGSTSSNTRIRFTAVNSRWLGFISANNQSGFQAFSTSDDAQFTLVDCSTPNILCSGGSTTGGVLGMTEITAAGNADLLRSITILSTLGVRPFVFENSRKSVAWVDSSAPKTTASSLPDGTNFSLRYAVTSESANVTKYKPAVFPRLGKHNSLSDGSRTATLRFLVDNNILAQLSGGPRAPKNDEIWVVCTYVNTDGTLGYVTSQAGPIATPASLTSGSSGDWSATSYDVNAVSHSYTPYEISVSLTSVKTLTELSLVFYMGCQSNSVDNVVFIDPEWSLA